MVPAMVVIPIALQGLAMAVDELWFHRRRGLPRWERLGHPLDTGTLVACVGWLLVTRPGDPAALPIYIGLAILSSLFITKDEPVHARLCSAGEHWLHAVLFVLHPIVLAGSAVAWWAGWRELLGLQLGAMIAFGVYQIVYWNAVAPRAAAMSSPHAGRPAGSINNAWYTDLGARWY